MKIIKIYTDFVTLGQFLKLADLIDSGGQSKWFLEQNEIFVNNELESRRGRKIYPGYEVQVKGQKYTIETFKKD